MEAITGKESMRFDPSDYGDAGLAGLIDYQLNNKKWAITASADWAFFDSTKASTKADVGAILQHEYTVVGVDVAKKTIDLRNPWGADARVGQATSLV
jgi:hypothetical protein